MKKTYIITLLTAFMGFAQGAWADDIHITSIEQLKEVSTNVASGNNYSGDVIYLENDLTFDGTENNFTPIGSVSGNSHPFAGTFNGHGHTISGLNLSGAGRKALFGHVTGTVQDLTVSNSSFSSTNSTCAGIVASLQGGQVVNCHVTSTVRVKNAPSGMGGIVAICTSDSIIGCTSAAILGEDNTVTTSSIGGIVGSIEFNGGDASVQNCFYYGNSMNMTARNGAIIGYINYSTTYSATLEQNFYCTSQDGVYGIGYKDLGGGRSDADYDEKTTNGAVPARVVTSDADITEMGTAGSAYSNGITPYDYGVKYNSVYYSHVLILYDNQDNTALLNATHGKIFDVKLGGRTLYKDGYWNTMCLPFVVPGDGSIFDTTKSCRRYTMDINDSYYLDGDKDGPSHTTGYDTGKLYLFFKRNDSPTAGTPFLVKWETPGEDYVEPVFRNVTINSSPNPVISKDGAVTFTHTYAPVSCSVQDRTLLILGAGNSLYYPYGNGTATVKAFRAYFQLNNGLQMAAEGGNEDEEAWGGGDVKAFVLDLEGGTDAIRGLTPMDETESSKFNVQSSKIYNLAGQRVDNSQLKRGIYIVNGKKVLVK